jgi:hypothetical protein
VAANGNADAWETLPDAIKERISELPPEVLAALRSLLQPSGPEAAIDAEAPETRRACQS